MSIKPGPLNLITDVEGIRVGNAEDRRAMTGTTVILTDMACAAGVDVRGGGPGTRETDLLAATCRVDQIDAVVLSGGSAFGLAAGDGVTQWLAAQGRGYPTRAGPVPIVPGAILFDLANGGDKSWGEEPPYRRLGIAAAANAGQRFALGNAGAGLGAGAGRLKGGLGSASSVTPAGLQVGAIVAVNSFGSVTMPGLRHFWAWYLEQGGELGGLGPPDLAPPIDLEPECKTPLDARSMIGAPVSNTTIAVVATNARLDKADATRVAIMAQDGLARAIRPVHTPYDGDTVFCLATGRFMLAGPSELLRVGALAADCLARAVMRAVYEADSLGAMPGYRSRHATKGETRD
ncbi:MAG: P1 family peptidase [Alphaproteobacteria bacterium]|nr:P1 family peptidase [Alphaproteobacteria bacterium]